MHCSVCFMAVIYFTHRDSSDLMVIIAKGACDLLLQKQNLCHKLKTYSIFVTRVRELHAFFKLLENIHTTGDSLGGSVCIISIVCHVVRPLSSFIHNRCCAIFSQFFMSVMLLEQ